MAKARRLHAPGCVVHITARTQGHAAWFSESLRPRIAEEILAAGRSTGHMILAHTVMPNHFHIVVRQTTTPLSYLMHRVMHRSSILLRRAHDLQGHVFERRYWSGICLNPDYIRSVIVYVHLNAWRAGLCRHPDEYEWSSHPDFLNRRQCQPADAESVAQALRFFQIDGSAQSALDQYVHFVNYQMDTDRYLAGAIPSNKLAAPQMCLAGDQHWQAHFAAAAAAYEQNEPRRPLCDVAHDLLVQLQPDCPMDMVRSGTRLRQIVIIRRNLIAGLLARGYRGTAIARFLAVSESAVSNVAVSLRLE